MRPAQGEDDLRAEDIVRWDIIDRRLDQASVTVEIKAAGGERARRVELRGVPSSAAYFTLKKAPTMTPDPKPNSYRVTQWLDMETLQPVWGIEARVANIGWLPACRAGRAILFPTRDLADHAVSLLNAKLSK